MPRIAVAEPGQIEAVYRESYALWGGGLSFEGYRGLWSDLRATPWGRRNMTFWVLADGDRTVLSSLKCYRVPFLVDGAAVAGAVVGAVFTPVRHRRRGHARALLDGVLATEAREHGARLALLFSDVGAGYYERSGFRVVEATESLGRIPRGAAARPAGAVRLVAMTREHRAAVEAARSASVARARLSISRDAALWDFLRTRSRGFFDRYPAGDVRQRCRVALRGGAFAGYLVSVEGRGEWGVREVGSADGTPETAAAVLRAAGEDAAARGHRAIHGWLERELTDRVPEWRWTHLPRRRARPMMADLVGAFPLEELCRQDAANLTFLDQF